jgi:catechol 2,3-dioxygenase-like lactoylglutathione lyase family enzyme
LRVKYTKISIISLLFKKNILNFNENFILLDFIILIMVKEVRHAGIVVSNMDTSLKFYCDLLDLKIKSIANEEGEFLDNMLSKKNVKNKVAKLTANNGTALIELIESESFSNVQPRDFFTIGASHVAFTVDNLDKTYEYLSNNGVKFNAPPQKSPDGFAKVTFCLDPDNTPIELVEVLGK